MIKTVLKWLALTLFLTIVGGVTALFLYQYQRVPREVYRETVQDDRSSALLALNRFLEGRDVTVRHAPLAKFSTRPTSQVETAILLDQQMGDDTGDYERLLSWVNRGGHLILSAETVSAADAGSLPHPLLALLGIQLSRPQMPAPVDDQVDLADTLMDFIEQMTTEDMVRVTLAEETFLLNIPETTALIADESVQVLFEGTNRYGVQWLQLQVGRGRVSVFKSFALLENRALLDVGHLRFILRLLEVPEAGRATPPDASGAGRATHPGVTFLHPQSLPPFWLIALETVPLGFAALLVCALLIGWCALVRFGPVVPYFEPPGHSRLVEHIAASGRLVWRQRAERALIERLRKRLWRRIAQRYPGVVEENRAATLERIATRTYLPQELIHQALYGIKGPFFRRRKFLNTINAIQQVSRNL